jgi:hypothetical protein
MSKTTQQHLDRLIRQTQFSDFPITEDDAQLVVNYQSRPSAIRTEGYLSPPPDSQYGIVSPLTEVGRSETSFVVASGGTIYVPTQITMTDANGTTFVFNYELPTIS